MSDYDFREQQRQYRETLKIIQAQNRQHNEELRKHFDLLKNQLSSQ